MKYLVLFVMLCGLGLAACDDANSCDAGEERSCECEDGSMGIKICQDDGTWGPCECEGGG